MTRIDKIVTFLIFSTLFFSSYVLFKTPFEFYLSNVIVVLLLPLWLLKYKVPSIVVIIFPVLIITGIINVFAGNNESGLLLKITVNLLVFTLFYYYVFVKYEINIKKIFSFYCKGAYWVSIVGIVQVISYRVDFSFGYDYTFLFNKWALVFGGTGIRLNSIFSEPSYFGASIAPAFFVSVYSLIFKSESFYNKNKAIIIVIAYFLTFSTVAYLGVFVTIILFSLNFGLVRYFLIFFIVAFLGYTYLYNNVTEFKQRIDGVTELYTGQATTITDVHGSSFVLYNNAHVAIENLKRNPVFGTGLGSHAIAYKKYSLASLFNDRDNFNNLDGNSMLVRLGSETGLFGVILIFIFLIKFFVKRDSSQKEIYWIISNATLVMIILQLMRQGNYTYNGFIFYMWLYYFVHKKYVEEKTIN